MHILVTGGAGYIGIHTVRALLEQDHTVIILDNLEYGSKGALDALGIGQTLIQGSVTDAALLEQIFEAHSFDGVIHFAAYKRGNESLEQPSRYFLNNVGGTFTLLAAMAQHGVNHFIFSSSGAVYGNAENIPVREEDKPYPLNPYGEGKLLTEKALPWYTRAYGITYASLRYFNAAGAARDRRSGEELRYTSNLIPLAIKAALGLAPSFTIYGTNYPTPDSTCIRDFIHVEDLAEVHLKALYHIRSSGRSDIYNIGTGQPTSVLQIVEKVKEASGVDFRVDKKPGRAGDAAELWADTTKARNILSWQPRHNLDDMVSSALAWHKAESGV